MPELAEVDDLELYQSGDPEFLLSAAEATVRAYCGWHIAPVRTDTLTVGSAFVGMIPLPTLYLSSVDSVTEDGTLLTADDYTVNRVGYLTRVTQCLLTASDLPVQTVVVFTHGYAQTPLDVQSVVLALANRLTGSPGNLSRVGQVQYVTDTDSFTAAEKAVLRLYRVPATL